MTTVAVLGTGIMGAPMAVNLARAGFDVRVWNRTRDNALPLADDGVRIADTPRKAADGADFLLTMLLDTDAVESTVTGADGALEGRPGVWIQSATVGVAGTDRLAGIAADAGVPYVDAPVLGTKQPAEKGQLTVLASGPDELRERCQPVFDAIGQRTIWVGATGRGTRLKLVLNSWVVTLTTAVAQAMALADGLGLDPKRFLETIEGGPLDVPYAHLKGEAMIRREFPAAFPLGGALKDARLIAAAARDAGVSDRLIEAVGAELAAAADAGHGEEDIASVWYAVAARR
jgi:3-hydroxyisobutyrate dehydrogenase